MRIYAGLNSNPEPRQREQQAFNSVSVSAPVRQVVGRQFARSGDGVALLNAGGTMPQPLGPFKQLTVARGDTVEVVAYGMYQQPARASTGLTLMGFVASLLQPAAGVPVAPDGGRRVRVLPLMSVGLGLAGAVPQLAGGVPRAYVLVLVYNQDSVLVDSQTSQLTSAAQGGYEQLSLRVFVPAAGYVQAYVATESEADVFFDDIGVEHRQGLQVQENHYDPFGVELVGVSRLARPQNRYTWNGKERQTEFGLNWHDHGWRFYDPSLGRWVVTDPDGEQGDQQGWTSYQFGMDNAVRYNDLDGRMAGGGGGVVMPVYEPQWAIYEVGLRVMQTLGYVADKFSALFSTATTTETGKFTPTVSRTKVDVKSSIEVKTETKIQTNLKNYFTPTGNSNSPTGSAYKVSTTVKTSKVTKVEVSGKYRGTDIKAGVSTKVNVQNLEATALVEASANIPVGKKQAVAAGVSVESNSNGKKTAKATLKADYQATPKTKVSNTMGLGFSFKK